MASAKDLRKRIASVTNTQQITKAMKMVAAAKLRRAQDNIMSLRPYAREINRMILALARNSDDQLAHPLLQPREEVNKGLLLVVTSDRGLCGSFNGSAIKAVQRFLRAQGPKYKELDLAFVGKKGYEFFRSRKPGKYHANFFLKLDFKKSQDLAQELIEQYLTGAYDDIKIIYNEFKSAIAQKVTFEQFLPVHEGLGDIEDAQAPIQAQVAREPAMVIFEPSPKEILQQLLPKHFAIQVHRIMLESLASEHAARMNSMENATRNAGEMIRKLTLIYNKTRQAGITRELMEIVSGAEAQKT